MAVERKLIEENKKRVMMREFLHRETARAGYGGAQINRTPMGIRINLVADRPGFVIGRRGSTIKKLTAELAEKFDLENPQIEVQESNNPDLNPQIMAQKLADALERGWHFRRAGHSTLRRIMESGAKGAQITMSGKITGGRSRVEKFTAGHIKHCGDTAEQFMRTGFAVATKKLGTGGITVSIMDPRAQLPDDIEVVDEVPEGLEGPEDEEADEEIAAIPSESEGPAASTPGEAGGEAGEEDEEPEAEPETEEVEPEGPAASTEGELEEPEAATRGEAEGDASEAEGEAGADVPEPEPPEADAGAEADVEDAEPQAAEAEPAFEGEVTDIPGVGKAKADALTEAGFDSLAALDAASTEELAEAKGVGPKLAQKIKDELEQLRT